MANQVIRGLGVQHIALKAKDFEASARFYEALGMKPVVEWGEGDRLIRMYDIGNGDLIELFANGGDDYCENGRFAHLALSVENVEEAYEIALRAGAKPHIAPKVVPLDSRPYKMAINIAFVRGPSDEQIEFFRYADVKE